jgi:hypothetical protein
VDRTVQLALSSRHSSGTVSQQSKNSPDKVGQQLPAKRPHSTTHLVFKLHVSSTGASSQHSKKTPSTVGQQSPVRLAQDENAEHWAMKDGAALGDSDAIATKLDELVGARDWGAWGGRAMVGKGATVGVSTTSSVALSPPAAGKALGDTVGVLLLLLLGADSVARSGSIAATGPVDGLVMSEKAVDGAGVAELVMLEKAVDGAEDGVSTAPVLLVELSRLPVVKSSRTTLEAVLLWSIGQDR